MNVPDLPCPKCGSDDVRIAWCHGRSAWQNRADCEITGYDTEHFHRACQRCHYGWRTDDVLSQPHPAQEQQT